MLLAALTAILHRYTGSTDVSIGTLLDGGDGDRRNLVVIWTHPSGDLNTHELVSQVSAAVTEADANPACSISADQDAIQQASNDADTPPFHIAFQFSCPSASLSRSASNYGYELATSDLVVGAREETDRLIVEFEYDSELFNRSTIERFAVHFAALLSAMVSDPSVPLSDLQFLTPNELKQLLSDWNDTKTEFPKDSCVQQLFEAQVERSPDAVAVVFEHEKLTYRQLNIRANQLAHRLRKCGAGPDKLIGISVERSADMIVALIGIMKAGSAYVPLDPDYPRERLLFMLQDANVEVLVTQQRLLGTLSEHSPTVISMDSGRTQLDGEPPGNPPLMGNADSLAYVIYTSGSTGRPKGVMVSHRNVVNFFTGMDKAIGGDTPGTWLAVTSISFDISVLELFWTLSRGFTVVIYKDAYRRQDRPAEKRPAQKKMDFSLFYFANDQGQDPGNRYKLLLEGAKFADQNGFDAVWTPERHFHAFGGLYPNPSVTSAAAAAVTQRIQIRAGSVVLPLQNPVRVAEEWSVVDNLSQGRVGVSFASGWQVNDFVLAPQNYAGRKDVMLRELETVRRLWRGETVSLPGVDGKQVPVKIMPRPIQPELPIWLTATGNAETCRKAGQLGANLLTHLVGQKIEDLARKRGARTDIVERVASP
jgi:hypothetical protein